MRGFSRWGMSWLGLLWAVVAWGAEPGERVRLTNEHVDLRIIYAPGTTNELYLVAHNGDSRTNYASTNVVLVAREPAETTIPPGFEQFGEPGSPFWILPSSQDPQLLYLGISGEGLPAGTFDSAPVVHLRQVQAPGWFFLWQFDPGGNLLMRMDSRNGIGPEDAVTAQVGSHAHYNWGFSSNGVYEVTFQVEARLAGATTNLTAQLTTFRFEVEPVPVGPASPAVLSVVVADATHLRCQLTGDPGATYQVQSSLDLTTWTNGELITAGASPIPVAVPLPAGGGPIFLRALNP
ncbi:MAG: choice-of-anchor M domain-containing protein [Verrucomicrobia bacterium]|nr:choice-of-anchor M domain-containing protein [Verrucomicrobiota bacterium]